MTAKSRMARCGQQGDQEHLVHREDHDDEQEARERVGRDPGARHALSARVVRRRKMTVTTMRTAAIIVA